jgi:hypothetical protein
MTISTINLPSKIGYGILFPDIVLLPINISSSVQQAVPVVGMA